MKLPQGITSRFGRQILHVQTHSPKLLLAGGIVGVVGAGVLACRSTLKLSDVLTTAEKRVDLANQLRENDKLQGAEEYTDASLKRELAVIKARTVVDLAKLYTPALGLAALSIVMITGSHVILSKRNTGLAAAYAGAMKAFDQYRERVKAELGDDKDDQFRYGVKIVEEEVAKKDGSGTKTVKHERVDDELQPSMYARFFDKLCENWQSEPEYNRIFLQAQQNFFNQMLISRGHVFLNEVYDALGFDRTGAASQVGWLSNGAGDNYIDFGIFDDKTGTGSVRDFVNGREGSILLDFNVDGPIYNLI